MLRLFKFKELKDSSVRNESLWYEGKNNIKEQVFERRSCINLSAFEAYEELV